MEKTTARRVGLKKEIVLHNAVNLSAEKGIDGWSMRDIASKLDVTPSVVYHYYPNKEALCDAVVDAVCADIVLPDAELEWKDWFTAMAHAVRPVLLRYHGITDRFMRGKFTAQFLPILDVAYNKLLTAGFGDKAGLAYSIITNSIIHTIGARNLRSTHQTGERHDLETMLTRFEPMMEQSTGLRHVVTTFLAPLSDPETAEQLSQQYYDLMIATVLDGLEHVVLPQASAQSNTAGKAL